MKAPRCPDCDRPLTKVTDVHRGLPPVHRDLMYGPREQSDAGPLDHHEGECAVHGEVKVPSDER